MSAFTILRIEVDGHFHGSSDVPKPWVARITGVDEKYGLAREFVDALRDYAASKRSWAGRLNGVVACFPLRDGNVYEVSRLRGRSSKRYVAREFLAVREGDMIEIDPVDALAVADPHPGDVIEHEVPDGTKIGRVGRIGTPDPCGFLIAGPERERRRYRLRIGAVHEVTTGAARHLVIARHDGVIPISQAEALARLASTQQEFA